MGQDSVARAIRCVMASMGILPLTSPYSTADMPTAKDTGILIIIEKITKPIPQIRTASINAPVVAENDLLAD
jgi:hypothetical protein